MWSTLLGHGARTWLAPWPHAVHPSFPRATARTAHDGRRGAGPPPRRARPARDPLPQGSRQRRRRQDRPRGRQDLAGGRRPRSGRGQRPERATPRRRGAGGGAGHRRRHLELRPRHRTARSGRTSPRQRARPPDLGRRAGARDLARGQRRRRHPVRRRCDRRTDPAVGDARHRLREWKPRHRPARARRGGRLRDRGRHPSGGGAGRGDRRRGARRGDRPTRRAARRRAARPLRGGGRPHLPAGPAQPERAALLRRRTAHRGPAGGLGRPAHDGRGPRHHRSRPVPGRAVGQGGGQPVPHGQAAPVDVDVRPGLVGVGRGAAPRVGSGAPTRRSTAWSRSTSSPWRTCCG